MCRGKSDAFNTIRKKARAIMHLYAWGLANNIDIEFRFQKLQLLNIEEIESLHNFSKLFYKDVLKFQNTPIRSIFEKNKKNNLIKLKTNKNNFVSTESYTNTIRYIRFYLIWLADYNSVFIRDNVDKYNTYVTKKNEMLSYMVARVRSFRNKSSSGKDAFNQDVQNDIIEAINPGSINNPWSIKFIKERNQIYILLSLSTGLRRGEMLKIQVQDFDPLAKTISLKRRPDDKYDTRDYEPNVKTLERVLEIEEYPCYLLVQYIKKRRKLSKSKYHPYLFVNRKGDPLSYNSAGKIYLTLRDKNPNFPENLTQHLVRHTLNFRMSELMKSLSLSEKEMNNYLKEIMGWSKNSKMPERYNQTFIRKEANLISLALQKQLFETGNTTNE
jgi:integrase